MRGRGDGEWRGEGRGGRGEEKSQGGECRAVRRGTGDGGMISKWREIQNVEEETKGRGERDVRKRVWRAGEEGRG